MSFQKVKLGDYVDILSGFAFKSAHFTENEGLPLVRIRDVITGKSKTYYAGEYSEEYVIDNDDLLIGMDGDFNREKWKGGKALLNQRVCKITADGINLDQQYLYHFLPKELLKIHASTPAVTVKHLSVKGIKDIDIPLCNINEQQRIAAILDKADAIRRKRQQAIQLADQFLRSVFLDIFGDPASSSGEKSKLGDIVLVDAPMVDPREEQYLDMIHIGPDRIEKNTGELLPALTAREEGLISKKFLFDERYILYSKIRPYLKKCALAKETGLCSADMYPIRPVEGKMTREFLWRLLLSDGFTRYTESLPGRANIPKLNRTELANFEFVLPHIKQQAQFSKIINKLHEVNSVFGLSRHNGNILFSSISQKAFAGGL